MLLPKEIIDNHILNHLALPELSRFSQTNKHYKSYIDNVIKERDREIKKVVCLMSDLNIMIHKGEKNFLLSFYVDIFNLFYYILGDELNASLDGYIKSKINDNREKLLPKEVRNELFKNALEKNTGWNLELNQRIAKWESLSRNKTLGDALNLHLSLENIYKLRDELKFILQELLHKKKIIDIIEKYK